MEQHTEGANDVVARARQIAREIAAPAAGDVDKNARFPKEAIDAQKTGRLLGAFIPKELGGLGCGMIALAGICEAFGSACGSSGLITAMHEQSGEVVVAVDLEERNSAGELCAPGWAMVAVPTETVR